MKITIKNYRLAVGLLLGAVLAFMPQAGNAMARIFVGPKAISKFNLSDRDKKRIDAWLAKNKLNAYGDPEGTMYAGGTPLFNERTGSRIDRYDYLAKKFPTTPWKQEIYKLKTRSEK